IDVSNLMPICSACDKPTRVGHAVVEGKKERICKKCGAVLETKKFVEKKAKATVKKRTKKEEVTEKAEVVETAEAATSEPEAEPSKTAAVAPKATATAVRKKVVKE
ncbi:MAG: hypothetical protein PHC84_02435, partial [Clostridia bacterium]|nr:hypothetical protein [Clostridia bacterium]